MTPKKIAILGGGNGAHTMAAEMTLKGHTVNLYEMPRFRQDMKEVFDTKTIVLKGNIPLSLSSMIGRRIDASPASFHRSARSRSAWPAKRFQTVSNQ